jgi:hypothetical protein
MDDPKIAVEVEAGTKNGYKVEETRQRIESFQKEGYKVYIIVPNDEVRDIKYKGFQNVYTAIEFWRKKV